ncbi:hypothetical protein EDF22_2029 [Rathayibacter sp. PhB127]|uniref:hypothetical protein n=1 Tax=unclassified Rathayibacter TaxID=2609250 RepID=UPI000FBAA0D2|nr:MULTISPECIES: hypothetical protein [unclassified Rathayibacter]ROS30266.1 hypothetical protein EDF22_2029 [Rathayibacter sp. PhB127]TDX79343.1 hypothetical protein EDF35_2580 [Rathayibacter sp. PhB151]
MTPDERHPHDDERGSSPPPGIARRTAVTAAWTTPVVAAAVAAPGASASPAPAGSGAFLGVTLQGYRPGVFVTAVFLNAPQTSLSPIVLERAAEIRITAGHDVAYWGSGIVAESPRAGRLLVPAGSYSVSAIYDIDGRRISVAYPLGQLTSGLTSSPTGSFPVTVAVVSGPVYPGPDPSVTQGYGLPSQTIMITV